VPEQPVATERLFSYGTLRDADVQRSIFGRRLEASPDVLVGYRLVMIRVRDAPFVELSGAGMHRNLEYTGAQEDRVEGEVLALTPAELRAADAYEPEGYARRPVTLASGGAAWLYVNAAG
jgi:gamma-glutamylcyclotransferase (GGCT)/AIG2-like uncharacterized protein YtfP